MHLNLEMHHAFLSHSALSYSKTAAMSLTSFFFKPTKYASRDAARDAFGFTLKTFLKTFLSLFSKSASSSPV